jgi:hypothetical protein
MRWTMTRSMTRWTLAGYMTLAALGAAAVLGVGSNAAQAAPSVSPFAGSWSGTFSVTDSHDPDFYRAGTFEWTVSDAGRITGTYFRTTGSVGGPFWFSGNVRDDGDLVVVMHNEGGGVPHAGAAQVDGDELVASATDTFSPRAHTWSLVATRESD